MECLHALRFFAKLMTMDPTITMDGWSEIYRKLADNPHWVCGCPNQHRDQEWERWREWLRDQMGEERDPD